MPSRLSRQPCADWMLTKDTSAEGARRKAGTPENRRHSTPRCAGEGGTPPPRAGATLSLNLRRNVADIACRRLSRDSERLRSTLEGCDTSLAEAVGSVCEADTSSGRLRRAWSRDDRLRRRGYAARLEAEAERSAMKPVHSLTGSRVRQMVLGCAVLLAASPMILPAHAADRPLTDADVERWLPRLRAEAAAFTKTSERGPRGLRCDHIDGRGAGEASGRYGVGQNGHRGMDALADRLRAGPGRGCLLRQMLASARL